MAHCTDVGGWSCKSFQAEIHDEQIDKSTTETMDGQTLAVYRQTRELFYFYFYFDFWGVPQK